MKGNWILFLVGAVVLYAWWKQKQAPADDGPNVHVLSDGATTIRVERGPITLERTGGYRPAA